MNVQLVVVGVLSGFFGYRLAMAIAKDRITREQIKRLDLEVAREKRLTAQAILSARKLAETDEREEKET